MTTYAVQILKKGVLNSNSMLSKEIMIDMRNILCNFSSIALYRCSKDDDLIVL